MDLICHFSYEGTTLAGSRSHNQNEIPLFCIPIVTFVSVLLMHPKKKFGNTRFFLLDR